MSEWKSKADIYADFHMLSDFKDEGATFDVEINKNTVVGDDKPHGIPERMIAVEPQGNSDRDVTDRIMHEVTHDLRNVGVIFEEECSFFQPSKISRNDNNEPSRSKNGVSVAGALDERINITDESAFPPLQKQATGPKLS